MFTLRTSLCIADAADACAVSDGSMLREQRIQQAEQQRFWPDKFCLAPWMPPSPRSYELVFHITGGSGSGLDRELDVISPFISGPKRPPKPAVLSGIVELEWELLGEPPSHREGFDPRRAGRNVGHMYPACSTLR